MSRLNDLQVAAFAFGVVLCPLTNSGAQPTSRDCLFWRLYSFTFQNRDYFEPLMAEVRAANVKVVFPGLAEPFRYGAAANRHGGRWIWDVSLGKEIPIQGCETAKSRQAPLPPGHWGIGLWLPISFHMVEDLFDKSSPIINTDYRFSFMLKAQRALERRRYLGLRMSVGHESTHLGDEFSLGAQRRTSAFERINVSYEFWDIAASYERRTSGSLTRFRAGSVGLLFPNRGYYTADTAETNGRTVLGSSNVLEPYVGTEFILTKPVSVKRQLDFAPYVSAEARFKTIYDYNKTERNSAEDRQLSVNLMLGLKRPEKYHLERGVTNVFLQLYHGVNPNGQFREQRGWTLIGLGLSVPL